MRFCHFEDVGVFLEELDRQQDQVVEVHRVVRLERALVVQVDDGGGLLLGAARLGQGLAGRIRSFFQLSMRFLISSAPSSPAYSFCMMSVSSALMSPSSKIEKPGL